MHCGGEVVDGGPGGCNIAYEAGPNVSLSPEVFGSAAAQLAKSYNLTGGSRDSGSPPNYPFTALRVDQPGSDWSHD
eukprot:SAG11_NODE_34017_length_274_cov_0.594286_1_plen_75_part_01